MSDTKSKSSTRIDTRGLPEDLDPRYFYEYRIMKRSKEASGIEGLILNYMPRSVIRSLAFAIDPYSQFRTSSGKITPTNRTVTREFRNVFDRQVWTRRNFNSYTASTKNYQNIPGREGPTKSWSTSSGTSGSYSTQNLLMTRSDTTRRTRIIGSTQGELELLKPTFVVPPNVIRRVNTSYRHLPIVGSGAFPEINDSEETVVTEVIPGASLSKANVDSLRSIEKSHANELIQKHSIPMYAGLSPQFRNFSFFRELVELRDLPRSILQLKDTLWNLAQVYKSVQDSRVRDLVFSLGTSARDIPKEYVGYHFGWKLVYKALMDLLTKPEQASKQISLLIRRSGKATTYRSRRIITSVSDTGIPGFAVPDIHPSQSLSVLKHRIERTSEIRMVVNSTYDFPEVNRIKFAETKFLDKLGVFPRPTDLYNLVPWSWLLDWFTGMGDYVNIIDEINRDKSLINWGVISVISRGKLITNATANVTSTHTVQVSYSGTGTTTTLRTPHNYEAHCDFVFHCRRDLGGVPGLRKTSDIDSLSPYQKSILGALITLRAKYSR